ncbi:MAG TPA: hypothetical protein VGO62_21050 [Myxococcota bacterium]|jgi:hypothetical protein
MSKSKPSRAFLVVVLALTMSGSALAGHAVDEPPALAHIVKSAPRADVDKALASSGAADRCKDELSDAGLLGVECRSTVATALVRQRPITQKADVDARAALFADLAKLAPSVSSWEPLTPPPGLARARFDAHRAIARALFAIYDEAVAAPLAAAFVKSADPKNAACTAAARTVELATGADASLAERGAVQSLVTSHACFLDESRLSKAPTPTGALSGNKDAQALASSTSASGAITDYAASRALDLQRCIDKHIQANGKADDDKKLEACACGAVSRWHFPAPGADVDVAIPLAGPLAVRVSVASTGATHSCGPVVDTSKKAP